MQQKGNLRKTCTNIYVDGQKLRSTSTPDAHIAMHAFCNMVPKALIVLHRQNSPTGNNAPFIPQPHLKTRVKQNIVGHVPVSG